MADEKLNTGPAENTSPEAAEHENYQVLSPHAVRVFSL